MKRKLQEKKEDKKQNLAPKRLKQILNQNKIKPFLISPKGKGRKTKKFQINKTHSMEEISNIPKNTERTKTVMNKKILNNSMEELDYLNFSEIDLDIYNKNSSFGEDIFDPKYYCLNKEEKKQIVQNRYNMVDTSFDTIKTEFLMTEHGDDYIDSDKNILLKTPSTICNYYEKSEIYSEKKNENKNKNKNNDKQKISEFKKLPKNKSIQIPKNKMNLNLNNNIINYNNPINSNRIKPSKNFSSSNIKITQNNNNHTNTNFYKFKGSSCNNTIVGSRKKLKNATSILKKMNKDSKKNIYSEIKNKNNLMKNYLKGNLDKHISKNRINSNAKNTKKKSFSMKNYFGPDITSKISPNNKILSNSNYTNNNDLTSYLIKKKSIPTLMKSVKEMKENISNTNINNYSNKNDSHLNIYNNYNYSGSPNELIEINQNDKNQVQQKPIMLCLDKTKFNEYFVTSIISNSEKKGKQKNSTNSNNNKDKNKDNDKNNNKDKDKNIEDFDKDYFNFNNNINENYTGRNNPKYNFMNMKKDIIVKRKKLNKTNYGNTNYCIKSIGNNIEINNKTNTTYSNYKNDKPIIKVNLKKHIKSSTELMKFVNVDSTNKNKKNKITQNNNSILSACTKHSINTSQIIINEIISKKKILNSPSHSKNNTILKISKTLKENNNILNKIKTTPKYNKINKGEGFSSLEKKNYVGSNNKGYYSLKYELSMKNNSSNAIKNKFSKNSFKPKTQSDIKTNKYSIKEDNLSKKSNKENMQSNGNEYGMDERVKQKLLDRMNKVSKNNYGIWGGSACVPKNGEETFSDIMKSPYKDCLFGNNFYCNKKIISNENSKNDEKDLSKKDKSNDIKSQREIKVIKEYRAFSSSCNNYN